MASWFSRHEALDQPAPAGSWWGRLKTGLGLEAEEQAEPSLLAQVDAATTLNRTQVGINDGGMAQRVRELQRDI